MRIQNNIAAGQTNRYLAMNNDATGKSSEKLSSGYRINSAGDDAAGLAISEKMRAQIRGLDMAVRNSQDATSLIQTAEGALQESTEILKRMRDLAVQSSNGVYDDKVDRAALNKEMDALKSELDRISTATEFNGKKLLNGEMGGSQVGLTQTGKQLGTTEDEVITVSGIPAGMTVKFKTDNDAGKGDTAAWAGTELTVNLEKGKTYTQEDLDKIIAAATGTKPVGTDGVKATIGDGVMTIGAAGVDGGSAAKGLFLAGEVKAATLIGATDYIGFNITSLKGGADVREFAFAAAVAGTEKVELDATTGKVTITLDSTKQYTQDSMNELLQRYSADVSVSFEGSKLGNHALFKTGTVGALSGGSGTAGGEGLKFQIGANGFADQQVALKVGNMSASALGVKGLSVGSQDSAKVAIAALDKAINSVSSTRADLGALQNRMSHTIKNLNVSKENLSAAESRIRDVDMAAEMTIHTKNNILSQAATAMLAQANQQPQGVLQLLR